MPLPYQINSREDTVSMQFPAPLKSLFLSILSRFVVAVDIRWLVSHDWDVHYSPNGLSIPNQEDHGFYPWVNWSSGTGCSPLAGVSWEPWALSVGLHILPLYNFDTFDGAKPRFLNRGKKRRSVSTLSPSVVLGALSLSKGIPRALVLSAVEGSARGVEWVDSAEKKPAHLPGDENAKQ